MRETARQVAHELKNPLTPIRFAVDRLRRDAPPALAETVEVLATESERLETMARSFAQFGRLPEGPRAAVDVGELVRSTARSIVPSSMTAETHVEEALPLVHGHYDALSRALTNVVLNAIEACGGRGRIGIEATRCVVRGAPGVEIVVTDSGPGIAPERLSRIWDPYVTSKAGGTGLGLAIVRQTLVAHGGEVGAENEAGGGATIRLRLPAEGPGAGTTPAPREHAWQVS
jgi:signal transduction histidine kinase